MLLWSIIVFSISLPMLRSAPAVQDTDVSRIQVHDTQSRIARNAKLSEFEHDPGESFHQEPGASGSADGQDAGFGDYDGLAGDDIDFLNNLLNDLTLDAEGNGALDSEGTTGAIGSGDSSGSAALSDISEIGISTPEESLPPKNSSETEESRAEDTSSDQTKAEAAPEDRIAQPLQSTENSSADDSLETKASSTEEKPAASIVPRSAGSTSRRTSSGSSPSRRASSGSSPFGAAASRASSSSVSEASSSGSSASSGSSSSSAASASDAPPDEYDYDYPDYDYEPAPPPPPSLPFTIFDDVRARPPADGALLPSSCTWAIVQCCSNPDAMGGRVECFSHLGCPGAWLTDFCTPTTKKLVLKMVLKSFQFSFKK